ncbi:MAG: hypothetical protein N3F66_00690 [Spirochaetes bacterium]|nr:hypothetical protein [Spirochaetota bacterium]
MEELNKAFSILQTAKCGNMFISGSSNIAFTLPYVIDNNDIAMFPGGIITYNDSIFRIKDPSFGVTHSLAVTMATIAMMSYRAAITIKNEKEYKAIAQAIGFAVYTANNSNDLQKINISTNNSIMLIENKDENMLYIIGNSPCDIAETILKIKAGLKTNENYS